MDLRRARGQDWLMGGLGAVLVVSLFLGWYRGSGAAVSAWRAFAVIDVFLLAAGLVAMIALGLTLAHRTPAVPLGLTSLGFFVAAAAALLAVIRLIFVPELPGGDPSRLLGAWIGTGAALGLVAAMLASLRDERTPVPPRSLEEQAAAVRTLSLSSNDRERRGARAPGPEAT